MRNKGQEYADRIQQAHLVMMENYITPATIYMSQDVADAICEGHPCTVGLWAFMSSAGAHPIEIIPGGRELLYMSSDEYDRYKIDKAFEEVFLEDTVHW